MTPAGGDVLGDAFVIDADPDELLHAGRQFAAMGEHLATQATVLARVPADVGDAWQGHTATAIKSEMTALAERTAKFPRHFAAAAQSLTGFAHAVIEAQAQVGGLNRARQGAAQDHMDAVRRAGYAHDVATEQPGISDGDVQDADGLRDRAQGRADEDRGRAQARLVGQYDALVAELAAHARRVGEDLRSATITATGDQSTPIWMRPSVSAEQAAMDALMGGLPLLHQRKAQDAASDVRDLLPAAAKGDVEALRRLQEQGGSWATDPYFAHALASTMGPGGFTNLANQMQTGWAGLRGAAAGVYLSAPESLWLAKYVGTVIAVATNPAYDTVLDETSRAQYTTWREKAWLPGWIKAGNDGGTDTYLALTQFLEAGAATGVRPGAAFMRTLGPDILAWDKKTWTTQETDKWGPLSPAPQSLLGGLPNPAGSLLLAASGDRATEQALLLSDVDGSTAVRYLVKDRHFDLPLINAAGVVWDAGREPDYNHVLGEMVIHADMDRTDEHGTHLASEFANAYIDGVYDSKPLERGDYAGQSPFGVDHGALRPALAQVLGYHADDLVKALSSTDEITPGIVPGENWGIGFSDHRRLAATFADLAFDRPDDLGKDPALLTKEGRTPPALSQLLRLVIGHTGASLSDLAGQRPLPAGVIAIAAAQGSTALRYIIAGAQEGRMGNAEAHDAANAEMAQLLSEGIGLIPLDKLGPAAGVGGLALSRGADSLLAEFLPTDLSERRSILNTKTTKALGELLYRQIRTSLSDAHAWDPAMNPARWLSVNFPNTQEVHFIDDRGKVLPRMTGAQSRAFGQFLDGDLVITNAIKEAQQSGPASVTAGTADYIAYQHPSEGP